MFVFVHYRLQIESLHVYYERWRDSVKDNHPEHLHHLPEIESIGMHKFAHGCAVMTDTCNAAQKLNRLLAGHIAITTGKTVHNMYCHHHLRNIHTKAMLIATTSFLREVLQESLAKFDKDSRVSPDFYSLA